MKHVYSFILGKRFQILLMMALMLLVSIHISWAQSESSSIIGKVIDAESQPIAYVNVVLLSASDSTIVKVGYTLEDGKFLLPELGNGSYRLKVSFIGYKSFISERFRLGSGEAFVWPDVILENEGETLDEVVVQGEVPLLEIKQGRIIFNVAQSINTVGISTLDLLRKTPNLLVDNAGNIRMLGRSGAIIAVNGKILPLTGADLSAYLQTIESDQIESIELIADPGVEFDAVGTSGVVNIRLKKNSDLGANGSFVSGYSIGNKSRYNTGLSGNYRNKLLNVYGSYSFNRYQDPYTEDVLITQGNQFVDLNAVGDLALTIHALRAGMDINLSPKSTLGFLASGSFVDGAIDISDRASIGTFNMVEGLLRAESNNALTRSDLSFNLNYRFLNDNGTIFNVDADYAYFDNRLTTRQPNLILDPAGENVLANIVYFTDSPTIIDIKSIKVDNERVLGQGRLSMGLKYTDIRSDNKFGFFREENGGLIPDLDRSNDFRYDEVVSAAYISYNVNLGEKITLNSGLRTEYTQTISDLQTLQNTEITLIERDYLDFFPNLNFGYNPSDKHDWSISANRRINRPNYKRLNPFQVVLNEFFLGQGNPFLLPEYATAVAVSHTLNSTISSSLTYNEVKNFIGELYLPQDNNRSILTPVNIDKQRQLTLNLSAPITITEWWEAYGTFTGFYLENKFDTLNTSFDANVTSMSLSLQNTFVLPKSWTVELSGFYNSPTIWGVNQRVGTIWTVDIGASKSMLDNRGLFTIGVSDIFLTNVFPATSTASIISVNELRIQDTRRLLFTFNYKFGNTKVKAARRRATGLDEEKRRSN